MTKQAETPTIEFRDLGLVALISLGLTIPASWWMLLSTVGGAKPAAAPA